MTTRLYLLQRLAAVVMAPLVLGHLALILWATARGLSAAEILGRTRGSVFFGATYTLFVVAASLHAAIGLRAIAREWSALPPRAIDALAWLAGLALLLLGLRAVHAVVLA